MSDQNDTIEFTSSTEAPPARRRRRLIAVIAALILAIVAASLLGQGGGPSRATAGSGPSAAAVKELPADERTTGQPNQPNQPGQPGQPGRPAAGGQSNPSGAPDEAIEDELDTKDNSDGYADGGANVEEPSEGGEGGTDGPLEPLPGTGCTGLKAGASLLVTPSPAVLPPGTMTSALSVSNCGKSDVNWTAATVPTVALASKNGTLVAGSTAKVEFTIDSNAYEPGAIDFKIKVSEPGHNHYVDVHAFRPTFGKDIVAGNGQLSAGEDAGGCANQCIVKAILTPNLNTPNLKLDVKTHTPATIKVWWAEQPPNVVVLPKAASPKNSTEWTTSLAPLKAATKYYLVVKATDGNGKTSTRSTAFTTITPYENPGGLANAGGPAGCALQCITKALLSGGADFSSKKLEVASNTPARFVAQASAKAPAHNNGIPSLSEVESTSSTAEYRTTWTTTLTNLRGSTKYHIVVRAIDEKGNSAYQVGSFTTPEDPGHDVLYTFLRIEVTHDGDSSWKNRGELSFRWGVGDTTVGSLGEDKMSDPATVSIPRGRSLYLAKGVKGTLPTVYVSASERDADGLIEFCSAGSGVPHEAGSNGDCDAKWNVAKTPNLTVDSVGALAPCTSYGLSPAAWAGKGCMMIETASHGDDFARFRALIAIEAFN
jgi:hypothetical protein